MKRRLAFPFPWARVVVGAALLLSQTTYGHIERVSTLALRADAGALHLGLTLNPFELRFFSELDANRDGRLEVDEWDGQGEKIARRILEALDLRVDGQPVVANLAGLTQSYESHHLVVRAHFPARMPGARVSILSRLAAITSESHVTEVEFGRGERVQTARLGLSSPDVTFEPIEPGVASGKEPGVGLANVGFRSVTAPQANEAAVTVLLGLLMLAGVPPALFCLFFRRHQGHRHSLPTLPARAAAAVR